MEEASEKRTAKTLEQQFVFLLQFVALGWFGFGRGFLFRIGFGLVPSFLFAYLPEPKPVVAKETRFISGLKLD